MSKNP